MQNFELQTLREVVKENGPAVVENFEKKFKKIRVEGKRKSLKESTALYTKRLPPTYYTEAEQEHIEAMYMGTESEARKRFNNSRSRSQNRNQPQNGRERSQSQPRYNSNPNTRYDSSYRSRVDRFKSPGRRQESLNRDRSWTQSRAQPYPPIRCISCRCNNCYNNKKTLQEIKDLLHKKLDVKLVCQDPSCKC